MAEKRLGAAMKVAQKFPKVKVVYYNGGYIGKVPAMRVAQERSHEGWTEKALRKTNALIS